MKVLTRAATSAAAAMLLFAVSVPAPAAAVVPNEARQGTNIAWCDLVVPWLIPKCPC